MSGEGGMVVPGFGGGVVVPGFGGRVWWYECVEGGGSRIQDESALSSQERPPYAWLAAMTKPGLLLPDTAL